MCRIKSWALVHYSISTTDHMLAKGPSRLSEKEPFMRVWTYGCKEQDICSLLEHCLDHANTIIGFLPNLHKAFSSECLNTAYTGCNAWGVESAAPLWPCAAWGQGKADLGDKRIICILSNVDQVCQQFGQQRFLITVIPFTLNGL